VNLSQYVLEYISKRLSYFIMVGFCKLCEKNNLSPLSAINKGENEENMPNFEGLNFMISLYSLFGLWDAEVEDSTKIVPI